MMAWIIVILILAALIALLLLTPIHIIINSEEDEFLKAKYGLVRAGIRTDTENILALRISLPFTGMTLYPLKKKEKKETAERGMTDERELSERSGWSRIKLMTAIIWQVIKKFKVRRLFLDIDTGNVILNSNLYPFFVIASNNRQADLNINYTGNFSMVLDVHNNLLNVILVIIKNLFKRS